MFSYVRARFLCIDPPVAYQTWRKETYMVVYSYERRTEEEIHVKTKLT